MRIAAIHAVQPKTPGSPPDWRTSLGQIVVRVETDSGAYGVGVGGGGAAGMHVVHTVLREVLLGADAADVEGLHAAMCRHTAFYGRKGLVVMAISGVDLALWDLRGKAAGLPVARLLNPNVDLTRPIETYVTVFGEAETQAALAAGHRAVKLHVERFGDRPDPAGIAELAAAARRRLGNDGRLMIDAFARWDFATALAVARSVAPHDVAWLEEPLPPDDLAGYERLAGESPVPIAGGEHEYLAEGFRELIRRQAHAVLQPDVNWCGGLTTLIEIYRMAAEAGVAVCPHRGSEPFALAALAAIDPAPLAESPRQWFRCLDGAPRIENGRVLPASRPGFGVEVDRSLFDRD